MCLSISLCRNQHHHHHQHFSMRPNIYSYYSYSFPLFLLCFLAAALVVQSFSVHPGPTPPPHVRGPTILRVASTDETIRTIEGKSKEHESVIFIPLSESVIRPGITADTTLWNHVCPTVWENPRGVDVRLQWNKDDSTSSTTALADQIAAALVQQIITTSTNNNNNGKPRKRAHFSSFGTTKQQQQQQQQMMISSLAASLEAFMDFCDAHLLPVAGYTARIVATRGSPSTKCPAWHQDHVPVRWIQSLVGPGCEWVELADKDSWDTAPEDAESEKEEASAVMKESVDELNQRRIDPRTPIHQELPGEAVLLVGRLWDQHCRHAKNQNLTAVVHRSPSGFLQWEGRVLLTMDVLTEENKTCV